MLKKKETEVPARNPERDAYYRQARIALFSALRANPSKANLAEDLERSRADAEALADDEYAAQAKVLPG